MTGGFKRFWGLVALLGLVACDAGPSAVVHDGEGRSVSQPVASDSEALPVAPQARQTEVAQPKPDLSVTEDHTDALHYGKPLPIAAERGNLTVTRYGDWPLWSSNRKYSTQENARYHFERHGPEFSAKSYEDYMAMVHGFIHSPPPGTQTIRRNNGDTLLYDPKGNVFAVMTKAGAPRTLFRPDDGAAYWEKQKIIEAGRRTMREADS